MSPFHLAIQVHDLTIAKEFYKNVLHCTEGRNDDTWVDLNFFGHQLVCHLNQALDKERPNTSIKNLVDGHGVPVPHFGVVLEMDDWKKLSTELIQAGIKFAIQPYVRFQGKAGEQATMFFYDPSGNAIEIKAFKNIQQQLFEK